MERETVMNHGEITHGINANRVGFYAAICTTLLTIVTFGIALLTPPISGPSCREDCIDYPYLDITSRFPRDYYWMYLAIVLTLSYVVLMVCIHTIAAKEQKIFSHIGLAFAIISAATLVVDYYIQISVIQPSLLNGETDGIALLTQYNPHGIFIALEELGYLIMSVSFLFVAFSFSGASRLEKAIRWVFAGGFVLTLVSFIVIDISYGTEREYTFEIVVISINWLVLIVGSILLSRVFRSLPQRRADAL
jgi:hypothetical protein